MKKIAMLLCILFLAGCGSWIQVSPVRDLEGRTHYEKNYILGERATAFVGREIVKVKPYDVQSEIFMGGRSIDKLTVEARYRWTEYKIESEAGKEYPIDGTIEGIFFVEGRRANVLRLNDEWGVLVGRDGIVLNNVIYSFYHQMLFYPSTIKVNSVRFEVFKRDGMPEQIKSTTPGPSFELIYSGKNDVSINAIYREYTPTDLARPAFSQNITYQADAKQIRFKDFVIKIDDISNEQITYTVLEDGLK
jgi:hypothetical protein